MIKIELEPQDYKTADKLPSAVALGSTLGVLFTCLVLIGLVVLDLSSIHVQYRMMKRAWRDIKSRFSTR